VVYLNEAQQVIRKLIAELSTGGTLKRTFKFSKFEAYLTAETFLIRFTDDVRAIFNRFGRIWTVFPLTYRAGGTWMPAKAYL